MSTRTNKTSSKKKFRIQETKRRKTFVLAQRPLLLSLTLFLLLQIATSPLRADHDLSRGPSLNLPGKDTFIRELDSLFQDKDSFLLAAWVFSWNKREAELDKYLEGKGDPDADTIRLLVKAFLQKRQQLRYLLTHLLAKKDLSAWLDSPFLEKLKKWSNEKNEKGNHNNNGKEATDSSMLNPPLAKKSISELLWMLQSNWSASKYSPNPLLAKELIERIVNNEVNFQNPERSKIFSAALLQIWSIGAISNVFSAKVFQDSAPLKQAYAMMRKKIKDFNAQKNAFLRSFSLPDLKHFRQLPYAQKIKKMEKEAKEQSTLFQRGRIQIQGKTELSFLYNFSGQNQELILRKGDRPIMVAQSGSLFWPGKEVNLQSSSCLDDTLEKKSLYLNFSLLFQKEENGSLDFNFNIYTRPESKIAWYQLWQILYKRNFLVKVNDNQLRIVNFAAYDPFNTKEIVLTSNAKGQLISLVLQSLHDQNRIILDQLVYGKNQGTIFPLKYLKHDRTEQIRLSLPLEFYRRLFVRRIFKESGNDKEGWKKSDDIQGVYEEYKNLMGELARLKNKKTPEIKELAETLAKRYSKSRDKFWVWAIIANLYYKSYSFADALNAYERYNYLRENQSEFENRLRLNFPFEKEAKVIYFQSLLHLGKYDEAYQISRRELSVGIKKILAKSPDKDSRSQIEKYIRNSIRLADVQFRRRQAETAFRGIRDLVFALLKAPSDWEKSLSYSFEELVLNYIYLYAYLQKTENANKKDIWILKKISERTEQNHSHPAIPKLLNRLAEADQKSGNISKDIDVSSAAVRIKMKSHLPGQGKNFCVPITSHFILNHFQKSSLSQQEIARQMQTSDQGTQVGAMIKFMQKQGYRLVALPLKKESIHYFLSRDIPLFSLVSLPNADIGHMITVIGLDPRRDLLYFYEPNRNFAISIKTLEELKRETTPLGNILLAFIPEKKSDLFIDANDELFIHKETVQQIIAFMDTVIGQERLSVLEEIFSQLEKDPIYQHSSFITLQKIRLIMFNKWNKGLFHKKDLSFLDQILAENGRNKLEGSYTLQRTIGIMAMRRNLLFDAKHAFLKAVEDNPLDIYSSLYLGRIFWHQSDFFNAQHFLNKAYFVQRQYYSRVKNLKEQIILLLANVARKQKKRHHALELQAKLWQTNPENKNMRRSLRNSLQRFKFAAEEKLIFE